MRYQSLFIENFRGIPKLEIPDLKRINLLVGRNNCGKTSVLEAFFLLSGMSNPQLPVNIHNFRDLILTNDEDFSFMFRNMNFETPIILSGQLDNRNRKLIITPLYVDYRPQQTQKQKNTEIVNSQDKFAASTSFVRLVEGIQLDCYDHKNQRLHGQISLKESKVTVPSPYKENLRCAYLNQKTIMLQIDKQMEGLLVQKKLSNVIAILKGVEPNITDIRMGAGGMIFVDIGSENLMPLNIMGDGMRRILAFLAALADMKNGVLLIDEIENGFHYSSLKVAWKAILSTCKEYNVQLIATTHSLECTEALSDSYLEMEPEGDDIRLFRIHKEGEYMKVLAASSQVLKTSIEKEFEIR